MKAVYEDPSALKERIKAERKAAGFTQKGLAHRLGVSIGTVKRLEAGEEGTLGASTAERRKTAVLVAEATGRWDRFDLAPPTEDPTDWPSEVRSLRAQVTKLLGEVNALQKGEEDLQSRVERLEQEE